MEDFGTLQKKLSELSIEAIEAGAVYLIDAIEASTAPLLKLPIEAIEAVAYARLRGGVIKGLIP